MKLNYPQKRDGMYIISRAEMDDIAEMVLSEYAPHVLSTPQPVDIDYITEEHFNLNVIHRRITKTDYILGLTAFADIRIRIVDDDLQPCEVDVPEGTILINSCLNEKEQESRRRYTVSHELSHWILHRSYYSPDNRTYHFRKTGYIACKSASVEYRSNKPGIVGDWEEWQADSLAASLLMPLTAFKEAVLMIVQLDYIFEDYSKLYFEKLEAIAKIFNVSKKAVEIRLRQLGYLRTVDIMCD